MQRYGGIPSTNSVIYIWMWAAVMFHPWSTVNLMWIKHLHEVKQRHQKNQKNSNLTSVSCVFWYKFVHLNCCPIHLYGLIFSPLFLFSDNKSFPLFFFLLPSANSLVILQNLARLLVSRICSFFSLIFSSMSSKWRSSFGLNAGTKVDLCKAKQANV